MKISKSKQELARIISENGGWRDGAQFYASTCNGIVIGSKSKPKYTSKYGWVAPGGFIDNSIEMSSYLKNWHQTIVSRDEYFHLYPAPDAKPEFCESVMRSIPEPSDKPTIEQLAADYRNAKDCAERKQQEADAAKADADGKLKALVSAGVELGLALGVAKPEPELVIADWRDLEVGDEVEITESHSGERVGKVGTITRFSDSDEIFRVRVHFDGDESDYEWISGWRFIRRP